MTLQVADLDDVGVTTPPRKFTIFDAMLLIAVTALGLGWNRWAEPDAFLYGLAFNSKPQLLQAFNSTLWNFLPHLILWSLAVAALGLIRSRGRVREAAKRPGMAACLAASAAILFHAAWYMPFKIGHPNGVRPGILIMHNFEAGAFAVGGAWLILAVGGLWNPERSWIDRVGRMLGIAWIAAMIGYDFRNLFL